MSTDTAALLALSSRVEAGESDDIVPEILPHFGWTLREWVWRDSCGSLVNPAYLPRLTTSIDDIESLRQRVLPGWHLTVIAHSGDVAHAIISHPDAFDEENDFAPANLDAPTLDHEGVAPTEPAARLAALLRALAANKETSNASE